MLRKIITGDNMRFSLYIPITTSTGTEALDFSTASSVKVGLVSKGHTIYFMATDVELDKTWPEANWANGIAEVRIPASATQNIKFQGKAFLEVQITMQEDVEDITGFLPVEIITGKVGL